MLQPEDDRVYRAAVAAPPFHHLREAMWSASTAASSPTPDRNDDFIFESHCRPRQYRPGPSVMPLT